MKEVLKLALDALEMHVPHVYKDRGYGPITAIKEALAQPDYRAVKTYHEGKPVYVSQPEQEPVGWQYREANDDGTWRAWSGCDKRLAEDHWRQVRAIYTTPPKRPWVGLTDEEIEEAYAKPTLRKMYQAIEAKLKELNT